MAVGLRAAAGDIERMAASTVRRALAVSPVRSATQLQSLVRDAVAIALVIASTRAPSNFSS
jgi:hypothetical protein